MTKLFFGLMRIKTKMLSGILLSTLIIVPVFLHAWGFWAHQRINRLAVFTLPPEMLVIYKMHIDYVTDHAVDPDSRRYAVDGEAAHHYIDIDHYGEYPFDNVPRNWKEAIEVFSEDTLEAYGVLPYHLPSVMYQLEKAFREKDLGRIMKLSADIGHYVGDAHVPLHTTENYNGQMTGQKGIHGFWESRLPELFGTQYDFLVGKAFLIENISQEGWKTVMESHLALDSVLLMEQELNDRFSPDKKYGYESRNNITIRAYSREYSDAYHKMLSGMVERRMRMSVRRVGSYWYTAWVRAGSPDLSDLKNESLKIVPRKYEKKLQIKDRESQEIGDSHVDGATKYICCHQPHESQPDILPWRRLLGVRNEIIH